MPKKEKVPKPRKKRAKQDTEEGDMYFDYSQIQYDVDEAIKEPHSHVRSNFAGMLSIFHARVALSLTSFKLAFSPGRPMRQRRND